LGDVYDFMHFFGEWEHPFSEDRGRKSEIRNRRAEDRGIKGEKGRRLEDQKMRGIEVRSQRTEIGGRRKNK